MTYQVGDVVVFSDMASGWVTTIYADEKGWQYSMVVEMHDTRQWASIDLGICQPKQCSLH